MKDKIGKMTIFLLGLALLQQGIAYGNRHSDRLGQQANLIQNNDIDPSALFYMESKLALNAEKRVRQRVAELSDPGDE